MNAGTRFLTGCFLLALSLSAAEPSAGGPPGHDLFAPDRVLKIEISLPDADWDRLRNQERDLEAELSKERLERPPKSPYSWFSADVVIDGAAFKNVGVRKRGFLGSADKERPGVNLQLDRFVRGQNLRGLTALKLHNNKQDASNVRQALAYQVFRSAGVPAPRCNLATVTVNGRNLGVYSHLESVDDAFLQRQFAAPPGASPAPAGNLYEARISDFRPGWTRAFEKKNNGKDLRRDDLDLVVKTLGSDDASLLRELGRVLDIDSFITFWAVESLIDHWDGFNGGLNNCFVYHDPASGKMRFIPWGVDGTFGSQHVFVPFDPPASVWAVSSLARRLYSHPVTQEKYRARMRELLASVWNESRLLAEADRLTRLVEGLSTAPALLAAPQTEQLRQFIRIRRSQIEPELSRPAQPWNYPMRRELHPVPVGKISARFTSAWVPHAFVPAPAGAKAQVSLEFYGRTYTSEFTDVKAAPDLLNPQNSTVLLTGTFKDVSLPVSIWFSIPARFFAPAPDLAAVGKEGGLMLVAGQLGTRQWRWLATAPARDTALTDAAATPGAKVAGHIQAELTSLPWDDFDLTTLKISP